MNRRQTTRALTALLVTPLLALGACSSAGGDATTSPTSGTPSASGACPADLLDVVVSVDQWGDIVQALAGDCATVHVVLASSSVDPHDYEPSPADAAVFDDADLVVVNGADYDHWASDLAANAASTPAVVDAGEVVGAAEGANPHLWYSPTDVADVAQAVTDELSTLAPDATDYFADQHTAWTSAMGDYTALVDTLKNEAAGRTYAASESVFDLMAEAIGLEDVTPTGFAQAAANETDPTPGDVAAFESVLRDGKVDVLIYNTQTEGSIPEQVRKVAEEAGVPVVEVTETVAPGSDSFQAWQVAQLEALATALGDDA
ncbi:MAG: metal ABC transporter solute-binding protein, Zn/Mn family [Cellulomonadaceae bacterium]